MDRRRGETVSSCRVVAAEGFFLRLSSRLRGSDIVARARARRLVPIRTAIARTKMRTIPLQVFVLCKATAG